MSTNPDATSVFEFNMYTYHDTLDHNIISLNDLKSLVSFDLTDSAWSCRDPTNITLFTDSDCTIEPSGGQVVSHLQTRNQDFKDENDRAIQYIKIGVEAQMDTTEYYVKEQTKGEISYCSKISIAVLNICE